MNQYRMCTMPRVAAVVRLNQEMKAKEILSAHIFRQLHTVGRKQ